jgi:hypothetical protein
MLPAEALQGPLVELAGYRISDVLLAGLRDASLGRAERLRTVRLESDRAEADLKIAAPALWRRSEPANSFEAAELVASDIEMWCGQCGI